MDVEEEEQRRKRRRGRDGEVDTTPPPGRTETCLSLLKSIFNVCLCSFSKKKNGKRTTKTSSANKPKIHVYSGSSLIPSPVACTRH